MMISNAIRTATQELSATSDTARLDAELLMAHALGVDRSALLLRHMGEQAPEGFAALIKRRLAHEPVAYIIGQQEFYGRDFAVCPDVLIPRGDSETLIEAALEGLGALEQGRVLDLGTGSGALLLTILAERSGLSGLGVDCSEAALAVARSNAAALGLGGRAEFARYDWNEANADRLGRFDLIIANPPYVEAGAVLDRDVADYEPTGALFAGPDGLDDYKVLLPQLRGWLKPEGFAVFEIGHQQAEAVGAIAQRAGFAVETRQDLAKKPRCLMLR